MSVPGFPRWTVQELILKQHLQTRLCQFLNQVACVMWQGKLGTYRVGAPIHSYQAQGFDVRNTIEASIEQIADQIATHALTFWMCDAIFVTQARQYFPDRNLRSGVCNILLENLPCYPHLSPPQKQRLLTNYIEQIAEFVTAFYDGSLLDSNESQDSGLIPLACSTTQTESLVRKFVHSVFFALWQGWLPLHNSNLVNIDARPRSEQCDWARRQEQAVQELMNQLVSPKPINWTACLPFFEHCSLDQQQYLATDFSKLIQDGMVIT